MLNVSKSGYYQFVSREPSAADQANQVLKAEIERVFSEKRRCYGSPRVYAELRAQGIDCGIHRVARLMRSMGLKAKAHRRQKFNPCVHYDYPRGENLLKRCFKSSAPNRVWVSDITYINTREGWLYLAVIIDVFSRRIVGHSMA